jgi:hypothetical protein
MLATAEFSDGEVVGMVGAAEINAASGLVASRQFPGILWTHNDNGDSRLFAIDTEGNLLATFETGVDADDWEDVAVGPGPQPGVHYVYIADTGDNSESRPQIVVYRVVEPDLTDADADSPPTEASVDTTALQFQYPDGPHDTETLIVDPASGDIYLITKRDARSRIYQAAFPQSTDQTTTLELVGELTWDAAAAGDISPSGDELILKDLDHVFYYDRPEGMSIADALAAEPIELPYIAQPLGEGLTFDMYGDGYYTHSEGTNQPLYYFQRLSPPWTGDLNGDGVVDRGDARMFSASYGMSTAGQAAGDFNDDGAVTLRDLAMLQSRLGETTANLAAAAMMAMPTGNADRTDQPPTSVFAVAQRSPARRAAATVHAMSTDAALGKLIGPNLPRNPLSAARARRSR